MKDRIISLYQLYGFELFSEDENCLVFTYTNGYFSNAEILILKEFSIDELRTQLEDLGFSVHVIRDTDFEIIHKNLFQGFFSSKNTKIKIKRTYEDYCEKQKKRLCCDHYDYLQCNCISDDPITSNNIITHIQKLLTGTESQLIILEAAAGYGKTCTSYEVFNSFSEPEIYQIPMMTELSRNRKAAIFRYVLLSEIDSNFSSLSQKVVEYEIRNGNVPLIIDGFDELLSKSIDVTERDFDPFDETQGMLDTIADLLSDDSKAKILITSRKSAIFTGEKFDEWLESHKLIDKVTRIEIQAPIIRTWLDADKVEALEEKQIDLAFIANPILLSILRHKDISFIKENTISELITDYFNTVLEREKDRQGLLLEVQEQLSILSQLARDFAEFNISVEDNDFVKELLVEITKPRIEEYISRYTKYQFGGSEETPTEEEFIMKLLHNAFLDRIIPGKNMIGFINDFCFGYLLGQAVLQGYLNLEKQRIDYKFIDLICTSYMADELEDKSIIESIIKNTMSNYTVNQQLEISNKLFHRTILPYENQAITNISFSNGFIFDEENPINNCSFSNCIFDSCVFNCSSFNEVQFYNCTFYNPSFAETSCGNGTLSFFGCTGHKELAAKFAFLEEETVYETDFERIILEQFWKIGSDAPEHRRAFTTIKKGIDPKYLMQVDKALESLLQKQIIIKRSVCFELNFSKLAEIKEILGR